MNKKKCFSSGAPLKKKIKSLLSEFSLIKSIHKKIWFLGHLINYFCFSCSTTTKKANITDSKTHHILIQRIC